MREPNEGVIVHDEDDEVSSEASEGQNESQAVIPLPERLALTTLVDPSALLAGATGMTGADQVVPPATDGAEGAPTDAGGGIAGAMNNIGSAAASAQQSGSGATAQNIDSDGATSSASTDT